MIPFLCTTYRALCAPHLCTLLAPSWQPASPKARDPALSIPTPHPCTQLCVMPEPALRAGSRCLSLILSGIPKSFFSTFPPGTRWAHILVSSLRCSFGPADLSEQYSYSSQSNAVLQSQSRCWDPQPSAAQPRPCLLANSGGSADLWRPLLRVWDASGNPSLQQP